MTSIKQRTLSQEVTIEGVGLHSGRPVTLKMIPQEAETGIYFIRTDIDKNQPIVVNAFNISETMMSTNLGTVTLNVATIEHLMSALAGFGIDNLRIELSDREVPIMDGSGWPFAQAILTAGILELEQSKKFIQILKPIRIDTPEKWAKISPFHGFKMDFEIDFAHPVLQKMPKSASFHLSTQAYYQQLAHARTFGFMKDIEHLRSKQLALGGSLDNAIVIGEDQIINEQGLRQPSELVMHKILDALGDLYVAGIPILGHYEAFRSGHELNNHLLRKLLEKPDHYRIIELEQGYIDYNLPKQTVTYIDL